MFSAACHCDRNVNSEVVWWNWSGDSGGPLFHANYVPNDWSHPNIPEGNPSLDLIYGITSFGPPCTEEGVAGAYTDVGFFYEWIMGYNQSWGKDQVA